MGVPAKPSSLENLLHEKRKFSSSCEKGETASIKNSTEYERIYQYSITDMDSFWLEQCQKLDWITPPSVGCQYAWKPKD